MHAGCVSILASTRLRHYRQHFYSPCDEIYTQTGSQATLSSERVGGCRLCSRTGIKLLTRHASRQTRSSLPTRLQRHPREEYKDDHAVDEKEERGGGALSAAVAEAAAEDEAAEKEEEEEEEK